MSLFSWLRNSLTELITPENPPSDTEEGEPKGKEPESIMDGFPIPETKGSRELEIVTSAPALTSKIDGYTVEEYSQDAGGYVIVSDSTETNGVPPGQVSPNESVSTDTEGESPVEEETTAEEEEDTASKIPALHLPSWKKRFISKGGASLEWRSCTELPVRMKNAQAVFFNGEVHIGGGYTGNHATDCTIYTYEPNFDLWGSMSVSTTCKWYGLGVYNDQLVLVGGKEGRGGSGRYSNRITVWDSTEEKWTHPIPSMSAARVTPTVFSHGPYLIVAGGRKGVLDYNVEILDGNTMQWWNHTPTLPLKCSYLTSQTDEGHWYLMNGEKGHAITVLYSAVESFLQEMEKSEDHNQKMSSKWSRLNAPLPECPLRIVAADGFLLLVSRSTTNGGSLMVYAYIPDQQAWSYVGKLPSLCAHASSITTPRGELLFLGGDAGENRYSNKLYKVSLKAASPRTKKKARIGTVTFQKS